MSGKGQGEVRGMKNGEAEEKEVSRNRTGGQTGTEEEKSRIRGKWIQKTERGDLGNG